MPIPFINLSLLKNAINSRHHAMERFYDCEEAKKDRELNFEMMQRIKDGVASREDEEAALSLINNH